MTQELDPKIRAGSDMIIINIDKFHNKLVYVGLAQACPKYHKSLIDTCCLVSALITVLRDLIVHQGRRKMLGDRGLAEPGLSSL